MNLIIICVIAVIIFVLSVIGFRLSDQYDEFFCAVVCISCIVAIFSGAIYLCGSINVQKEIAKFEQQKQYIESHIANSAIEDAALTSKKIELNEWLYSVQWNCEHLGNWSLVPEYVMELEAIR